MPDFEPGPIALEPPPLPPPIFTGATVQSTLGPAAEAAHIDVGAFAGAQTDIGSVNGDGLDAKFEATIGPAADVDAAHPPTDGDQTVYGVIDTGDGSEAYRQSVLRYLPDPGAPVPEEFTPPPPTDPYPPPTPPPTIDIPTIVDLTANEVIRRLNLPGGTPPPIITPPPSPGPTPPPVTPPPWVYRHAPPGVDHLPSLDEVTAVYCQFLGGQLVPGDYDDWSGRLDWWEGIANSDEAQTYFRTGVTGRTPC